MNLCRENRKDYSSKLFVLKRNFVIFSSLVCLNHAAIANQTPSASSDIFKTHQQCLLNKKCHENQIRSVEGKLEVLSLAFNPKSKNNLTPQEVVIYRVVTPNRIYYLHFSDKPPTNLKTDDIVRINFGYEVQNNKDYSDVILTAHDLEVIKSAKLAGPIGQQKALVMLVTYQNNPQQPWTPAQIKDIMNTVNSMMNEYSYGKTNISTIDIVGWYNIAVNSPAACDVLQNTLPQLAEAQARANGHEPNNYDRLLYVFPRSNTCAWAGLGTIGGTPSRAWYNGYVLPSVVAHELGHNLGLWHAHYLGCSSGPEGGTCSVNEYGDKEDIMGDTYSYPQAHYNAFQKERLGWLTTQTPQSIFNVTSSGCFSIFPFETKDAGVKSLKILKGPNGSGNDYYYVEFRQPIGFDANIGNCGTTCDFTKGVVIHRGNSADPNTSNLLDMSPNDNNSNLVALLPGKTFTGVSSGKPVTITLNSISPNGANLSVNFASALKSTQDSTDYEYVYPDQINSYKAWTVVLARDQHRYQCKPGKHSGRCQQLAFEPGDPNKPWPDAWNLLSEPVKHSS